jgi:hypothetical protein
MQLLQESSPRLAHRGATMQHAQAIHNGRKKSHHSEVGMLSLASSAVPMQITMGARRRLSIPMQAQMGGSDFGDEMK